MTRERVNCTSWATDEKRQSVNTFSAFFVCLKLESLQLIEYHRVFRSVDHANGKINVFSFIEIMSKLRSVAMQEERKNQIIGQVKSISKLNKYISRKYSKIFHH